MMESKTELSLRETVLLSMSDDTDRFYWNGDIDPEDDPCDNFLTVEESC